MGFYLRKSVKVGPFRFNLSKSGVGVSAGVRGFRVGAGPRGNYVHMGRNGVYYRATIPSGPSPSSSRLTPSPDSGAADGVLTEIESGDIAQMTDSSSADLLAEFDRKRKKVRLAPVIAVIGVTAVLLLLGSDVRGWLTGVAAATTVVGFWLTNNRDVLAKTVVLFYDLEQNAERQYQQLHDGFDELQRCGGTWHIEAHGNVTDRKRHAGASSLVRRKSIRLSKGAPPYVKTNIEIPAIPVGRQTLYLFPDRLLVFEPNGVGAVSYQRLTIERRSTRFIEEGSVPGDATVVGQTWRYVNKGGGPDKRFKNNRQLPIALYEEIVLSSDSGLNELVQLSKQEAGQSFKMAMEQIASNSLISGAIERAADADPAHSRR
jgi:hypothetical protein